MLTDDLYAHAEARGRQTAVVCGDERLTYAELLQRVECLAQGLAAGGIEPGDPVALLLPNSPAFVVSFLAITGLGAIAVPLNHGFHERRQSSRLMPVKSWSLTTSTSSRPWRHA